MLVAFLLKFAFDRISISKIEKMKLLRKEILRQERGEWCISKNNKMEMF